MITNYGIAELITVGGLTVFVIAGLASLFYDHRIYKFISKQQLRIPLLRGMPNGLPIVTLYNEGIPFNFIIDTGSSISMLSMQAYKKLNIEQELDNPSATTHGLGGDVTFSRGCAAILQDEYKNRYEVIFNVSTHLDKLTADANIEELVIDGILGTDFLQSYGYAIDFDNLVMYKKV